MNSKIIAMAVLVLSLTTVAPSFVYAESRTDTTRIEKLEERVRDLEGRMAKVEGTHASHSDASKGAMGGMNHDGMPMGQMPQGGAMPGGGMPQGSGAQPPSSGMPAGNAPMGDM